MRRNLLTFCLWLALIDGPALSSDPALTSETSVPSINTVLLGLDLEFIVPDNLAGLSVPQTLSGAHLGLSMGQDVLQLSAFYNSNQETSALILTEVDYRFHLSTPFFTGYALAGLHYLHFRIALKDKEFVGPVAGFGLDLPMAQKFKMGLQMKLYYPRNFILGFGGGFSFLL